MSFTITPPYEDSTWFALPTIQQIAEAAVTERSAAEDHQFRRHHHGEESSAHGAELHVEEHVGATVALVQHFEEAARARHRGSVPRERLVGQRFVVESRQRTVATDLVAEPHHRHLGIVERRELGEQVEILRLEVVDGGDGLVDPIVRAKPSSAPAKRTKCEQQLG